MSADHGAKPSPPPRQISSKIIDPVRTEKTSFGLIAAKRTSELTELNGLGEDSLLKVILVFSFLDII